MRKYIQLLMALCICLLNSPITFARMNHEISVGVSGWQTDVEYDDDYNDDEYEAESEQIMFQMGYTYYFQSLTDNQIPNDLLPFMLHPSRLFFSAFASEYDYESERYRNETSTEQRGFTFGGRHYFPSNTGLGGRISFQDADVDHNGYSSVDKETIALTISVDQYVAPSHNIEIAFTRQDTETDDDDDDTTRHIEDMLRISYTGAHGLYTWWRWGVTLGFGRYEVDYDYNDYWSDEDEEGDIFEFRFSTGPVWQTISLMLNVNYTNREEDGYRNTETQSVTVSLTPRIWLNPHVALALDLNYQETVTEDSGGDETRSYGSGAGVEAKFRF